MENPFQLLGARDGSGMAGPRGKDLVLVTEDLGAIHVRRHIIRIVVLGIHRGWCGQRVTGGRSGQGG